MIPVRIIIFAKAPVPGRVKTRLISALGEEGAARLAREMLLATIEEAVAAAAGPVELCGDPGSADASWGELPANPILELTEQGQGNLGDRLGKAASRALREEEAVVLVGADCPGLDRHALRDIARELAKADAVICPAMDGGYVALGLNAYHPSIFEGIDWSTATVAEDTIERIRALGWSLTVREPLHDIDIAADLGTPAFTGWLAKRTQRQSPVRSILHD